MKRMLIGLSLAVALAFPAIGSANVVKYCTVSNYGGGKFCTTIPGGGNFQVRPTSSGCGGFNAAATPYGWATTTGITGLKGSCDYSWTSPTYNPYSASVYIDPRWCSCGVSASYAVNHQ